MSMVSSSPAIPVVKSTTDTDTIDLLIQRTLRTGTDTFRPEATFAVVLSETDNIGLIGQHP